MPLAAAIKNTSTSQEPNSNLLNVLHTKVKMLIFDRSIDPIIPLKHSNCYQSLVYDIFDTDTNLIAVKPEKTTNDKDNKYFVISCLLKFGQCIIGVLIYSSLEKNLAGLKTFIKFFLIL